MQLIAHRRNTIKELMETPHQYGIEVDIRSYGNELIIHHDPFVKGENFEDWIKAFAHRTLILNVKEEGLEEKLIHLMKKYAIEDYFFLDQSIPFLVKTVKSGEHRCAVRVSEYESIENALNFSSKLDWAWVDCFTKFPFGKEEIAKLKHSGFKICLVSPELQGRDANIEIPALKAYLEKEQIRPDAVCTKRTDLWEKE